MVERLKDAIERARQSRITGAPAAPPPPVATGAWDALPVFAPDPATLKKERIVAAHRSDVAHLAFDVLRTRILKVCQDNNWRRVAVTSPTKGCGKSMVSLNLAYSLARTPGTRALLVDLDLRAPALRKMLRMPRGDGLRACLAGEIAPEEACVRLSPSLAVCVGDVPLRDSAELLQTPEAATALARMAEALAPDLVLYDLPPMLVSDDVLAFLPKIDAVLLVAAAGRTTSAEIEECERLMGDGAAFLGVVLNKVERGDMDAYEGSYAEPVVT